MEIQKQGPNGQKKMLTASQVPRLIEALKTIERERLNEVTPVISSSEKMNFINKKYEKRGLQLFKRYVVKSPEYWKQIKKGVQYGTIFGAVLYGIFGGPLSDLPPALILGASLGTNISLFKVLRQIKEEYKQIKTELSTRE